MSRPRLMTLGFNIYGTGLTRVMRTLTGLLCDRFEIDYLGIGRFESLSVEHGVRMHPTNTSGGGDVFGAFQVLAMAKDDPPDVLLILHDIWMFEYYCDVFAPLRKTTKLVAYVPLDGNIKDPSIVAPLCGLDLLIVYTDWAAREIRSAMAKLVAEGAPDDFPPVEVIYHGVDTAAFTPSPALIAADFHHHGRLPMKQAVFSNVNGLKDSFIVLNAARPAERKRVDLTILGFAEFAKDKPDNVFLCLHHAITEPEVADLLALIDVHNIRDRVFLNPLSPNGGPLGEADLARLYGACDVGLNTSMGEGWGLVSFEHASTGAAQVIPDHTACGALWDSTTAQMVTPAKWYIPEFSPLEMGELEPTGVAAALQTLYDDRQKLRHLSKAGSSYLNMPNFRWPNIADQFAWAFETATPALNNGTTIIQQKLLQ